MIPFNLPASNVISSNTTHPYPSYQNMNLQPGISSSMVTQKKRVVTIDQGTSPLEDYFPQSRRTLSPLRPYKLRDMEIQLSPSKRNQDSFPTIVQPRFSNLPQNNQVNRIDQRMASRNIY